MGLKSQLRTCEEALKKSQSDCSQASDMLTSAQNDVRKMEVDMSSLMDKNDCVVQKSQAEIGELNGMIEDGKSKLSQANKEIEELQSVIDEMKAKIAELEQNNADLIQDSVQKVSLLIPQYQLKIEFLLCLA